jgi:hypothetical protein
MIKCGVMSATADSSCGELSKALQRNAKHEARLSNIQLLQFVLSAGPLGSDWGFYRRS